MLRHNLIITLRSILRYKSIFLINLAGLSTGLACVLLIYLWVNDELSMNKFHEKDSRLFQVMEHQPYAEGIMTTTSTPGLLAESLKEEFPQVKYAATTTWVGNMDLTIEEKTVSARGYHVGPDFFNIFSYGLEQGNADQVLSEKDNIVVSRELAVQLFGNSEQAVGQQLAINHDEVYLVSGVFEGTPSNSSVQFDFVLSYEKYKDENSWVEGWNNNGPSTFIILEDNVDHEEYSANIREYLNTKKEENTISLFLVKYSDRYLYGAYENGVQSGGRIEYVRMFSVIALFILVIACINFMNLSTARASRRAREVCIKKAVGAQKGSLIMQFLVESLLISMLSLFLAAAISWLFLPEFNNITGKQIAFEFSPQVIYAMIAITLFTGLLAGSYPAFYMSAFRPLAVIKGEVKRSFGELWARRGLVIFQFFLSVILIVSVIVIDRQINFINNKNLGYNQSNVIYFPRTNGIQENMDAFLAELNNISGVEKASAMGHSLMGRNNNTSDLEWEGKDPGQKTLFENFRVTYDMIELLEIEMDQGRTFSREFGADSSKIILNESAVEIMGLTDPIGKVIKLWGEYDLEIIGITKNFHFQSLHSEVNPVFFWLVPEQSWNIFARIDGAHTQETLEQIQATYTRFNPGFTFDYEFVDRQFANMYSAERRVSSLSRYFAGIAVLISCLGLFGLASFTAELRVKEIGIRKAMGASVGQIVYLLSRDFTMLVGVSIILAMPVSMYLLKIWLTRFAFRIDLSAWLFVAAGLVALLIAWFTVGYQAFKAARVNPGECLKEE